MGMGRRIMDSDKMRESVLNIAATQMMTMNVERQIQAALLLEQVRTNELLERLLERLGDQQ